MLEWKQRKELIPFLARCYEAIIKVLITGSNAEHVYDSKHREFHFERNLRADKSTAFFDLCYQFDDCGLGHSVNPSDIEDPATFARKMMHCCLKYERLGGACAEFDRAISWSNSGELKLS